MRTEVAIELAATVRVRWGAMRQLGVMQRTWTWLTNAAVAVLVSGWITGCPMDDDDDGSMQGDASASNDDTTEPGSETSDDETAGGETMDDESSGGETTGGEPSVYAVSGTVTRSAMLPEDGDGIGTLVVGAFAECDLAAPIILGAAVIPNADLSDAESAVEFSIEPLASGSVFLVSFLDDDGNMDPKNPLPDDGDPVLAEVAGDGILTCIEIVIDGDDVDDVEIDLNEIAMPLG